MKGYLMIVKFLMFIIGIVALVGCGPKIVLIEEPTVISNVQIEAEENCDIDRR
jgi:hypothetical protein